MADSAAEKVVPDDVIPRNHLPPLRYRDMPPAISWQRMIGPSIILAGLSLGSGEFVLWPYIVYQSGFVFFWACMLGVITQYFLNMEIERWTLVTGETAITGFCRLSWQWSWVMLLLNIIPWAWPGWATGAAEMLCGLIWGPQSVLGPDKTPFVRYFGIGGLLLVGTVLTAGPVVYNTVEKIQIALVAMIVLLVIVVAAVVVRWDAVVAMSSGLVSIGSMPDLSRPGMEMMTLLGALAFAGAGGTMNLGQSNYIRDKGYGMGKYIGRITSPITGNEEPAETTGYHFKHTPQNMALWRQWWRAANIEQLFSFLLTCVVCLCLLTLIAYSLAYDTNGQLKPGMEHFAKDFEFVWGEAQALTTYPAGSLLRLAFLIAGVAILLTTELGVLDATARISSDIVKVNYLRDSARWTQSRLYFMFLWAEIALGVAILSVPRLENPLLLLKIAAAMNGGVMFLYSIALLYMNNKVLSRSLSMSPLRFVVVVWSCAFFGYFTIQALRLSVWPFLQTLL